MVKILNTKKYLLFCLYLFTSTLFSQFSIEKITFSSANPFSFNDIISDLKNQEKQEQTSSAQSQTAHSARSFKEVIPAIQQHHRHLHKHNVREQKSHRQTSRSALCHHDLA